MKADLAARQAYSGSAEGQDLTYTIVQQYHNSVFEANHVDVDAWTPNKALNWLEDPAQKQALWNSFLTDGPILSFASIVADLLDVDQPGKSAYLLDLTNAGTGAAFSESNEFGDYSISIPGGGLLVGTGVRNQDLAVGSDQNDVLISFMGDDELRGGEGNDRLYGQDGNDRLIGGGGDDILVAGSGDDVVYTGYDDEATVQSHYDRSDDLVFSGDGNDVVYTSGSSDGTSTIDGDPNSVIYTTGGSDTISLGEGDDKVYVTGYGMTVIWGGAGADSFYFEGDERVLSITVDNMSEDLLKSLSTRALFDALNAGQPWKYDSIVINLESDDKIFADGKQLSNASTVEYNTKFEYILDNYSGTNMPAYGEEIQSGQYYVMDAFHSVYLNKTNYGAALLGFGVAGFQLDGFSDGVAGISFPDGYTGRYDRIITFQQTVTTEHGNGMSLHPDGYENMAAPTIDLRRFQIHDKSGSDGDDHFKGSADVEQINGGLGNDTVDYSSSLNGVSISLNGLMASSGGDAEDDRFVSIENAYGSAFDDYLGGSSIANVLEGGSGNDTLNGSLGNDSLNGGAGNDTYIYARGDGSDAITEATGNGNADKLVLSGINQADVLLVHDANNVTLLISESASGAGNSGSILIKDGLDSNSDAGIEQVVFADGTIWTKSDLIAHSVPSDTSNVATIVGTAGDDHITGTAGNDIIDSLGGNDYVNGGEGSDTYLYSVNDGDEYIDDEAGSMTDVDVLKMKDINYSDVTFSRDSTSNLILTVNSTKHVITLDEQYYSSSEGWGLEKIQFADGITVDLQHSDTVWTYHGSNGDDHIVGAIWGKEDVFEGGKGNDYLNGQAGSDTYVYSKGDGSDIISEDVGFTIEEGNTDILRFTDLNQSDLTFARDGEKLIVADNGTQDTITVERQFTSTEQDFGVEKIEFADGSSWGLADIWQNVPITGTSANDTLQGSKYNETLVGGDGDDTYRFNFGDGHDTIFDGGSTASTEIDRLVFGTGISSNDVTVAIGTNNSDLLLTVANGGGEITLKNQLVDNSGGVDQISFADGTVWDRSTLLTKTAA